jgi:DNA-directed RNA polymerase specialized sigma24 family protein
VVIINEAVTALLSELSSRQKQALLAYAQPGATLTNVGGQLGCSKSTVENEIHRTLEAIRRHAETMEEAEAIYARLLELLSPE